MVRNLGRIALWFASSTFFIGAAMATSMNVAAPTVDLGYAQYQGFLDTQRDVAHFLGIRYAAPPVGKLRFKAPQPLGYQSGIHSATEVPHMCHQMAFNINAPPAASEDCLFLNVYMPGTASAAPVASDGLPVLVWIHGGAYESGYAAQYDGADLVAESMNTMIVVVIQYRLGAFGFLAGNEVKAHGALNAGLLDQAFALQWVQDHIGKFGGNKDHVTIWGESAGAGSVLQHIVANGGHTRPPLFHAAIASSTYLPPQYYYYDSLPQSLYNEIVSNTGCERSTDKFACLQSVSAETLDFAHHNIALSGFYGSLIFAPVIDGAYILERPSETLARGRVNGQALLAVTNQNEGDTFVRGNVKSITEFVKQLFPYLKDISVTAIAIYYNDFRLTVRERAMKVMGESVFVCPTYRLLEAFPGRSWKGQFDIPPAYHGQDIEYYFPSYQYDGASFYNNTQFITAFSQSFISFAKSYDVNIKLDGTNDGQWTTGSSHESQSFMSLEHDEDVNTEMDPTNITPYWDTYDVRETEMRFSRTNAYQPVVSPFHTDRELRRRCGLWKQFSNEVFQ